jgi:hypothetical protein
LFQVDVYKVRDNAANISPLSIKREWMEDTVDAHAYKCFPVSLTNGLGWGLSFPEDITFIWDGISDTLPHHVKVLKGEQYVYTERANATISFNTGLLFKTDENTSILQMPVPNLFRDGVQPFTTIISTSFFKGELPCAWRITRPNVEITIKANTPIISILPISLTELQNSEMVLKNNYDLPSDFWKDGPEYSKVVSEINKSGKWSNFYRDAVNHLGKSIGSHEVKALRLKVTDRLKKDDK